MTKHSCKTSTRIPTKKHKYHIGTSTIGLAFRVGSAHDPESMYGIANFLSHMILRSKFVRKIKMFSFFSAFTIFSETTYYYETSPKLAGKFANDLVNAIFYDFKDKEVEKERKIILSEISRRQQRPAAHLWTLLTRVAYSKSGYDHVPQGTEEDVKRITAEDINEFRDKLYGTHSAYLFSFGEDPGPLELEIPNRGIRKDPLPRFRPNTIVEKRPGISTKYLGILWSVPLSPAYIYLHALLSGVGGLLWDELREMRGAGHTFYLEYVPIPKEGMFMLTVSEIPDDPNEVYSNIVDLMERVAENNIDEKYVRRADVKVQLYYNYVRRNPFYECAVNEASYIFNMQISYLKAYRIAMEMGYDEAIRYARALTKDPAVAKIIPNSL